MFEVHYWPTTGRVKLIHDPGFGNDPVVTALRVEWDALRVGGAVELSTAAFSIAHALAKAGDPAGTLIRHIDDTVAKIEDLDNLRESPASEAQASVRP